MENKCENELKKLDDIVANNKNVRKTYVKPVLELLGDLRTVTLGGSPFTGEDSFTGGPRL